MLKDKIILVTGGSGLIGREIVADIRKRGGICINGDICVETNLNAGTFHLDMTNEDSLIEFLQK